MRRCGSMVRLIAAAQSYGLTDRIAHGEARAVRQDSAPRRGDRSSHVVACRAAALYGRPVQAELIGREAESQHLDELIEGLADSSGALIVHGEPGIGKSALLERVRGWITAPGSV